MFKSKKEGNGLFSGVFTAYSILLLHVILIAAVGCVIIFFKGITDYILWILGTAGLFILILMIWMYYRMKQEKKALGEMLHSPIFEGRSVEVSFLGGLASVRLGVPNERLALENQNTTQTLLLEDPLTMRMRELTNLAHLLENNLITLEEYNKTKKQLLESMEKL